MSDPHAQAEARFSDGKVTYSTGRNGVMKTVGVWVAGSGCGNVRIYPINTKDVGHGHIEIPASEIDNVIRVLQEVRSQLP